MGADTKEITQCTGGHAVKFYETDDELAETVGSYLAEGMDDGVAIVIATDAHRAAIAAELAGAGIDPERAVAEGRLIALDAASTLGEFMVDGHVDPDAFRRVIGAVVRDAGEIGPVRAYGEMVALLWDAGNVIAVIELEEAWNHLGAVLPFALLCGYRSASVSGPGQAQALEHVCQLHTSVLEPSSRWAEQSSDCESLEAARVFAPEPGAPGAARRFIADALREWGHDCSVIEDAELVISELATNAVIHARSSFSVRARSGTSSVRLFVKDQSSRAPVVRSPLPSEPTGRGLRVVTAVAQDWGVEMMDTEKTVWAQLHS